MKYYVTLGDREYQVEVNGDSVSLDGTAYRVELRDVPGSPLRVAIVDGRSHVIAARPVTDGRWELLQHGETVMAEVLDERRRHLRRMAGQGRAHAVDGVIKAPMPGLVVRLLVEPGRVVSPGTGLVVLEAMKMENELKAPASAVVTRVLVRPGQAVEKGEGLVELGEVSTA